MGDVKSWIGHQLEQINEENQDSSLSLSFRLKKKARKEERVFCNE